MTNDQVLALVAASLFILLVLLALAYSVALT